MAEDRVDIRDLRDGGFLWLDKSALEFISRKAGNTAVVVYSWLCYYANAKAQNCFPSITTLANHCQISRRTVMRIIIQLEWIKVVTIERQHGKPNVYKLLDVKRTPAKTGDMDVTSDTGGTGVGAVVSPPLVTPGTLEQDLIEQDIYNKTAEKCARLWITQKDEDIRKAVVLIVKVNADIDIIAFMTVFRQRNRYRPSSTVMITVIQRYLANKETIKDIWAWFMDTVRFESEASHARRNIEEHQKIKKYPASVGAILSRMVDHENV